MTKRKPSYKVWHWSRSLPEGDDLQFYFLPLISLHREKDQWKIRIGWLKWIFVSELTKGYAINYLGFGHE